jgi:Flp pilus assembly protein TadG
MVKIRRTFDGEVVTVASGVSKEVSLKEGLVSVQFGLGQSPRRHAQALVEFALIVPVFILIVMGILDFSRVFYTYEATANAAREVARQCALTKNMTTGQMGTFATAETGGSITITASSSPACDANLVAGTPVTVTANSTFVPLTGVITAITGSSISLSATATMVVWQ